MLKRTITTTLLAAFVGVLTLAVSPATAELIVSFRAEKASLTYTASTETMVIIANSSESLLTVKKQDTLQNPDSYWDSVTVTGTDIDLTFTLYFNQLAGDNQWEATGLLSIYDETPTEKIRADFISTKVAISVIGATYHLDIEGMLSTSTGNDAILLGSGDSWGFTGTGELGGGTNTDGTTNHITMARRPNYDVGSLWTFDFGVNIASLDTFLSEDRASGDDHTGKGELHGSVVPVPAAIVLGLLGLGIVGWRMRRYA